MRKLSMLWVVGGFAASLTLGCASDKPVEAAATAGSAGGAGTPSGGSASAGSGGMGPSGGSGGSAGGVNTPTCTEQQVACNGACLEVGASMNGCTVLFMVEGGI